MKKDAVHSVYMDDNVRFADLLNGYVFGGEQVVASGDVRERDTRSVGMAERMQRLVNDYPIYILDVKKLTDTSVFTTDLRQVFDFIRFSDDKERLTGLGRRGEADWGGDRPQGRRGNRRKARPQGRRMPWERPLDKD